MAPVNVYSYEGGETDSSIVDSMLVASIDGSTLIATNASSGQVFRSTNSALPREKIL